MSNTSPSTLVTCHACQGLREPDGAFCELCGVPTEKEFAAPESRTTDAEKSRYTRFPKLIVLAAVITVLITLLLFVAGRVNNQQTKRADLREVLQSSPTPTPSPIPSPSIARSTPEGMAYVPGGEFMMGNDDGDEYERPAHRVVVEPFFIDIHEVSCADYIAFVNSTGHKTPTGWNVTICSPGTEQWPVTGIDWFDASVYARWKGGRLPTETEWEFAARGSDGRRFPWGNEWLEEAANAGDSSAGSFVSVGSYPEGKSPFGMMDMAGNAWEWTASDLRPYPGGRLPVEPEGQRRIIRGGSWVKDSPPDWTTTFRGFAAPSGGSDYSKIGFRCARDVNVGARN